MASCREFLQLFLDEWLEGSLARRRRLECDRHVAGCRECARYVASYRAMLDMIAVGGAGQDAGELPDDLVQSILRQVRG